MDISQYTIPNSVGFCLLDCKTAFEGLKEQEKKYAHYIARASWYGGLIVLYQTSPESPGIYLLLVKMFKHETLSQLQSVAEANDIHKEDFNAFLIYSAAIFCNVANYKSFGDTKIIPNLPKEKFEKIVKVSQAYTKDPKGVSALWSEVEGPMYSLTPRESQLGLGSDGTTCYFSGNCTKEDADIVKEFMVTKGIPMWNTRCLKHQSGVYEIRLASVLKNDEGLSYLGGHNFTTNHQVRFKFVVKRGDYSQILSRVCENLEKAKDFAANDNQRNMLDKYIESFTSGSIDAHKVGSRYWIKDKGPVVESYLGFVETYRDPVSSRAEFEGFVAMVNKEMSAKFCNLVSSASTFLQLLPWPASLEKDRFLQPDFTSLDVLAFAGSTIWSGINIPNYDEIRQREGFKNVSLGNVLSSKLKNDKRLTFVSNSDNELLAEWKAASFEVQVGLHELLGHGSGKLFAKNADGTFNFDEEKTRNPLNGELISSWYENNETYYSRFSTISSSYEECRAECVGLLLCIDMDVLSIFGYSGESAKKVIYANWLNMVRAGLLSLEFYSPDTNSWRQAHMQARYVILQVLLEAGDLVTISECTGSDGKPDLLISLDESKIETVGKKAIADFLLKLQVYKATADFEAAKAMFQEKYSLLVDNDTLKFNHWRKVVLNRRVPRGMFVQCNTSIKDDKVVLVEYDPSPAGCVLSQTERFQDDHDLHGEIIDLWNQDKHFWP